MKNTNYFRIQINGKTEKFLCFERMLDFKSLRGSGVSQKSPTSLHMLQTDLRKSLLSAVQQKGKKSTYL